MCLGEADYAHDKLNYQEDEYSDMRETIRRMGRNVEMFPLWSGDMTEFESLGIQPEDMGMVSVSGAGRHLRHLYRSLVSLPSKRFCRFCRLKPISGLRRNRSNRPNGSS